MIFFMNFTELKHNQRIEMFHHFNSLSGDYVWRSGLVVCKSDEKFFKPDGSEICLRILPHRMDEIRNKNL